MRRSVASGFALLIVMVAAAVLLISLTAALPSIYQEGQREREAELIFRGLQYARAIANFHQKFQRYPASIQDLTKLTNGFRFLRKEYADPMTPNGKWRLIHANAQGVLLDSRTQGPPPGMQGQGQSGMGQTGGGFGTTASAGMGTAGSGFGQQGASGSGFDQQDAGTSGFGQQGASGSGFDQQGSGTSGFGQQGMGGGGFGASSGGFSSGSNFAGNPSNAQQNSGFSMGTSQGGGTFIVGVASTSHKQSIRTWNQKTHYDEWEFVGIDLGALGIATSVPGLPQGVGAQSNQGNQSNGFGQSGQGNQSNGFGQPTQGNPTNPGQNQDGFQSSGGSGFSPQ
jgi:type II secretory pathway pseudopilin PulG